MLPSALHVASVTLILSHTGENEVMVDCTGSETDAPPKVQVRAAFGMEGVWCAASRQVN